MKHKGYMKKIFCLPPLLTAIIAIPSYALVIAALVLKIDPVLQYISAYALAITVTGLITFIKNARRIISDNRLVKKALEIPVVKSCVDDKAFRAGVTMHGSTFINFIYVMINLVSGIIYSSLWFISFAVYYACLAVTRTMLLSHMHRKSKAKDIKEEWRKYRLVGIILVFLNIALSVIITLVVVQNRSFEYGGYLIYIMAAYTFYSVITSIVNLVKFRKYNSPVLSAAKSLNLVCALVSMLSLETAMISQFGSPNDVIFRRTMIATTGFFVAAIVLGMAIVMIKRSTRIIKKGE